MSSGPWESTELLTPFLESRKVPEEFVLLHTARNSIQFKSKPDLTNLLKCASLKIQMSCPFVRLSEMGAFCNVHGEAGECKEKYGQTESDTETEARIRQFEASLEDSSRCQTKAGVGPAGTREPWAGYLGGRSPAGPELGEADRDADPQQSGPKLFPHYLMG